MPLPILFQAALDGLDTVPYAWTAVKTLPWLFILWALKTYFGGARNTSERNMHSKGALSGVGLAVAHNLAARGAQLVVLTQHTLDDPFLQDQILDLRETTGNELITAEQCDLSSLHSIRQFATRWIDNAPPRRLDMIILCANTSTPRGSSFTASKDGVEMNFAVNYLANFHLLSILSPAIRAQPPDRDVRVIFGTCASYMGGQVASQIPSASEKKLPMDKSAKPLAIRPSALYASSKLALMIFADAFEKHLQAYKRPDKEAMNARVIMVDPGWCRTPGMRRSLTGSSLWGLAVYLLTWPLWWLILKSPEQGAQTFLYAAMDAEFQLFEGGKLLKEVLEAKVYREEVRNEAIQKNLWQLSEKTVEMLEKEAAIKRAKEKNHNEDTAKSTGSGTEKPALVPSERKAGSRRSRKATKDP